MTGGAATASIISDAAGFAALEPEWWELWRRAPSATPFQSPAWLIPWWEAFSPGTLHCCALRRHGRLVALAPFYLENSAGAPPRLLPVGISLSDYLDVLIHPEDEAEAAAALTDAMTGGSAWESWELPELRPDAKALALPSPPGCEAALSAGETCPYLPLPGRPEDLRASLPVRKRRSLSLDRNRAERRGAVSFHSLATDAADDLLDELLRLHALRWQSRGESGVLADERVQAFHREALPRLTSAGLARLYAIRIGGETAAVYYGLHRGTNAYAYLSGMHPDFAYESPGTLLFAHAMQEAVRDGAREFHFLRGGEAYKYKWGARDRWNQRRVFTRRRADAA